MITTQLIDIPEIAGEVRDRLLAAADDRGHPMRLFTVATVDDRGRPDARLLVLRGASPDHRRLWFHTDRRSPKVEQLRHCPVICAIAYDGQDGVQLRVRGTGTLHENDDLARRHWEQIDIATRCAYAVSSAPGEHLVHPDPRMEAHRRELGTPDELVGKANFLVIELVVDEIEWFQASLLGDRRAVMRFEHEWRVVEEEG
jgi:general stress protein 26